MVDVYLNEKYIGDVKNPDNFIKEIKEKRKTGKIPLALNVYHNEDFKEIILNTTKGRARRLIIKVEDGKSLLTNELIDKLLNNEVTWDQLLSSRVKSAMATGSWVGGRKGVSQNIDRTNFTATLSHLHRVVSLLSSSQENFAARALHPTHYGKLCPVETPEGTPIGLRKNLAMLCKISEEEVSEDKLKKTLESCGLNQNG